MDMNDYQFDTTQLQSTHQPRAYTSEQYSSQNDKINDLFNDIGTGMAIIMAVGVTVFILWLWSMIAMIGLSIRFKDFVNVYEENERNKNTEDDEFLDKEDDQPTDESAQVSKNKPVRSKQDLKRLIILSSICAVLVVVALVVLWLIV